MTRAPSIRLLAPVWAWTIFTGVFAWLPLVRIVGRPEGYTWGVLGLTGEGADGPWWIFLVATAWVVGALFTLRRGPRPLARLLVPTWHVAIAGIVGTAIALGGRNATWQGQGLHFEVPMWILVVPFALAAVAAVAWAVLDRRDQSGGAPENHGWSRGSRRRLIGSVLLLVVALALFRAGDNYNWITATAIIATILHWILLAESFDVRTARGDAPPPRP